MNIFSPIETTRLLLLPGENSRDNIAFLQMLRDDGDFRLYSGTSCCEQNLLRFDGYVERDFQYAIYRKDDPAELLGLIGLGQRIGGPEGHNEIDFYIRRSERGKGYCTEALHALCNTAFAGTLARTNERKETEPLIIDKIYAVTSVENLPTKSLLEKNGFLRQNKGAKLVLMAYNDQETDEVYANRIKNMCLKSHKQWIKKNG